MKKPFLIFVTLFLILSCNRTDDTIAPKEPVESKCNSVIVDSKQYESSKTDPFDLIAVTTEKGCLKITINYGGGCKDVSVKLINSGSLIKTNPGQRDLKIILTDDDICKASITEDFYFDISKLKVEGSNKVQLNFEGTDIKYMYKY